MKEYKRHKKQEDEVKDSSKTEYIALSQADEMIEESEKDIKNNALTSQESMKKEISKWRPVK